jgi:hypothetical protein
MPPSIRISFRGPIRHVREEQEINQEEAAERCGLHRTYYCGVERGGLAYWDRDDYLNPFGKNWSSDSHLLVSSGNLKEKLRILCR